MGFAEEKVYNHILKNMSRFCDIHVASLVDSLSCLTDADRDELHTRQEMRGIRATVYRFYQHLKCRKGWVTDLINALHQNNAGHLAEELQKVYDSYRSRSRGSPGLVLRHPGGLILAEVGLHGDLTRLVFFQLPERKSSQPQLTDGKEKPLPYPTKMQKEAVENAGASSTVLPSSVSPEQKGQEWLSRRHPVCVDNGCFGNANHLQRGVPNLGLGRSLPPRDLSAAPGPEQSRNEPQEDVYFSSELPVRLAETTGGRAPQHSVSLRTQEEQAAHSSKRDEAPSSHVDVRSPLLIQQQFDAEQKVAEVLRQHEGGGDVQKETTTSFSTSADISPFCDTSLKPPVGEKMLPGEEAASSTPSVPEKEKVLAASAASLSGMTAAGSFEGSAGRIPSRVSSATSIWASHDREEEDVELSKPGVLHSVVGESPKLAAKEQDSSSSNTSSHLGLSSDPLMVSSDSSSPGEALSRATSEHWSATPAAHADPAGEEAAGASSHPPLSWASPSVGIHKVHVEHHPSALLAAGKDVRDGAVPLENSPDSSRGCSASTSSSQAEVPTSGDSNGPSLLYILPAVGIALISVFLVYTRWQK
ncbi:hypothetical protein ASZ78_007057 [Callipepla squamata]|uniref:Caspase recruitment domain-containing protein n=1 Tax=Callipepla squamata TaxID=9009 RepID=A0A226MY38_CALSU|nr:hypothetical protein ASZ78_007057 [Callipepla squamata]